MSINADHLVWEYEKRKPLLALRKLGVPRRMAYLLTQAQPITRTEEVAINAVLEMSLVYRTAGS